MKVRSFIFFMSLSLAAIIFSSNCFAQVSTSPDLLNNAKHYDGKTVYYKGEVIGDVMIRGDYAWLHVNDGSIAIGIWAPTMMIQDIGYIGDYHKKGDTVGVSGMFHRSCLEHGGDLDIHAVEIMKITPGSLLSQPVNREKIRIAAYSLILVMLFLAVNKLFQSKNRF